MDKIKIGDIDFSNLEMARHQGTKSTMYVDGDICIKIFTELYPDENKLLYRKLLEMDGLSIDNVLFPKSLIVDGDMLLGYTMDNFKDSINLLYRFSYSEYESCKEIFEAVKKASLILRKIHNSDIICHDLSFDNILIDKNGNIMFCDIDGCRYRDYGSPYMSVLLNRFLVKYRKLKEYYISENMDRISFMLSFFLLVYLKEIQKVSKKDYNLLAEHLVTLQNCRVFANNLVDKKSEICEIPYMDELICDSDEGYIIREGQLSLKDKLLRKIL